MKADKICTAGHRYDPARNIRSNGENDSQVLITERFIEYEVIKNESYEMERKEGRKERTKQARKQASKLTF